MLQAGKALPSEGELANEEDILTLALQLGLVDEDAVAGATEVNKFGLSRVQTLLTRGSLRPEDYRLAEAVLNRRRVNAERPSTLNNLTTLSRPGEPAAAGQSDPTAECSNRHAVRSEARGRFVRLRPHARGGLGEVSVALDVELNREVALKEILPAAADEPELRERFLREAEITGSLEHPGIVPVYGLGQGLDGRPFYAMKFVEGETLRTAIDSLPLTSGSLAERIPQRSGILERFLDICDAIQFAHDRGVIHRDLKPDNILLGCYGETLVIDWGLARRLAEAPDSHTTALPRDALEAQTVQGQVIGTPAFMSPEQAEGRLENIGPATDVYGLGAILFYILMGCAPHRGDSLAAILAAAARNSLVPTAESHELLAIAQQAMAKTPELRFPTARELQTAVRQALSHKDSLLLVSQATELLGEYSLKRDTFQLLDAMSMLRQAIVIWPENEKARRLLYKTQRRYLDAPKGPEGAETRPQGLAHFAVDAEWIGLPGLEARSFKPREAWVTAMGKRALRALLSLVFDETSINSSFAMLRRCVRGFRKLPEFPEPIDEDLVAAWVKSLDEALVRRDFPAILSFLDPESLDLQHVLRFVNLHLRIQRLSTQSVKLSWPGRRENEPIARSTIDIKVRGVFSSTPFKTTLTRWEIDWVLRGRWLIFDVRRRDPATNRPMPVFGDQQKMFAAWLRTAARTK